MGQLGFYFNQNYCIGCRACQAACKDINNLDTGILYRRVTTYETGTFPTPGLYSYAGTCNHCENPACVMSCVPGALTKADDTTVQIDKELCLGCKQCIEACPYHIPQYNPTTMVVGKCIACAALRAEGENPACVDACNMRVLEFGDLDELRAKHGAEELTSDLPILPSSAQTTPSVLIKPRPCALEPQFVHHPRV